MTHGVALRSLISAGRYRLTGHRAPVAVWFAVTHRCDALCTSCSVPLRKTAELDTDAMLALIDGLAQAGMVRAVFTGGEPLERADLGVLLARCAERGVFTQVETNGHRYPERAEEIASAGELVVALDGPEPVHDALREPGSHARAMAALRLAHARGARVRTRTVLAAATVPHLDAILAVAEHLGHTAEFQPFQHGPYVSPAVASQLAPDREALHTALRFLLEAKAAGRPVAHTEKALRYLLAWPDPSLDHMTKPHEDLHCVAGQLFAAVSPDGSMAPCPMWAGRYPSRNASADLRAAFDAVRDNPCKGCTYTALVEYNYLYNLNADALRARARAIRSNRHGAP